MFVVNEPPPQIDTEMVALLRQAEPATIGHFRHVGFMDPGLRSLLSGHRIAGTAVTVRCFGPDTTMVHYALGRLRTGDVLVIDRAGDTRHAACGGGVAFAARAAGCVGIIIDGMATDIDELREYGLPVWARGLSTVTGKRLFLHGEFVTPISCGGVSVEPGDAILADENGAVAKKFGVPLSKGGTFKTKDADGNPVELTRGVTAQRWTFVIDKDGKIVHKNTKVNAAKDSQAILSLIEKQEK